jgi:hypothetical protein
MVSVFLPHPSWAKNIDCFKHCALRMTCWSTVREVTRLQEVVTKLFHYTSITPIPSLGKPAGKTAEKTCI